MQMHCTNIICPYACVLLWALTYVRAVCNRETQCRYSLIGPWAIALDIQNHVHTKLQITTRLNFAIVCVGSVIMVLGSCWL